MITKTAWHAQQGDILDMRADGLLCSANPFLNLSGGVGGAFLLRYGSEMQDLLHSELHKRGERYLNSGSTVFVNGTTSSYAVVCHAVAVNCFYETDGASLLKCYMDAFSGFSKRRCKTVVAACLGCGYGKLKPSVFCDSIATICRLSFKNITRITFVSGDSELIEMLGEIEGVRGEIKK
jgi:O-acetyl-ADP-ribose deacetylase (regulator of RNase III)